MIQLKNLCLEFGEQKVFDSISLTIDQHERIGLVGRNGSGKSTLLKAIAGTQYVDSGSVVIAGKKSLAYMAQEMVLQSTKPLFEETFSAYTKIYSLRQKMKKYQLLAEQGDGDAAQEYAQAVMELQDEDEQAALRKTKEILLGLGFKHEQFENGVDTFSVGWQMRVVLAKLLLQDASFYIFDEPTNHLDIVAQEWFLHFLKNASFGFVLVCHDRYFLNQACTKIIELERGKATMYQGNYSFYEEQKELNKEAVIAAYHQQQREHAHKKKLIDKFRAKANKAKMAKSMQRQLDKDELIELPPDTKTVHFSFQSVERSGKAVLTVKDLSYAFADKTIFNKVTFTIERGQKVALVAPNGAGKTTLFNVLVGKYPLQNGSIDLGYNVHSTFFEQEQHKVLDPEKTILEEVLHNVSQKSEQQVRSFLGSFLFTKDTVNKKTKVLSGGERNRVSMVKVLLQDANFLLLDEPTNHLDIQSKDILLKALTQFDGTILFVSHDHDFTNKLATHVLELTADGVYKYEGNYESYLVQKQLSSSQENQPSPVATSSKSSTSAEHSKEERKKLRALERTINNLESDIKKLHKKFETLEYGTDAYVKAQRTLQEKEKLLEETMQEWETLMSHS